jgi:hypothetical protein
MAGCDRGRVIANPASLPFCAPQVKLTTPINRIAASRQSMNLEDRDGATEAAFL